ncbi:hypothetical protein ABZP36_002360 [Zizania latifolia]
MENDLRTQKLSASPSSLAGASEAPPAPGGGRPRLAAAAANFPELLLRRHSKICACVTMLLTFADQSKRQWIWKITACILLLSLILFGFYALQPPSFNNYFNIVVPSSSLSHGGISTNSTLIQG